MKVKELIKQLKKVDPNFEVVLSSDGEGNSYSPLSDFAEVDYQAETTWSGEVHFNEYEEEDPDAIFEPNAIVLFPIN